MFDVINSLFERYGFTRKALKSGGYYLEKPGQEYWVVIKEDADAILDRQEIYYEDCKALSSDPALDKNLSMLVLWETDGTLEHEEFKRKKMNVEEDQYYFKKYVLGYSIDELVELKQKFNKEDVVDYIEKSLISEDIFKKYKGDPFTLKWYSLLYRIAIKVPFVKIIINESEGLQSLFSQNNAALEKAKILPFNNIVMEVLGSVLQSDIDEIKEIEAEALFNALQAKVGELDAKD